MTRSSACFPMNSFSKETFSNFFQKLNSFIRFLMVMVWVFVLQSLARKLRPSPFFLSSTIYHILAMLSAKTEEIISKFKSFKVIKKSNLWLFWAFFGPFWLFFLSSTIYHIFAMLSAKTEDIIIKFFSLSELFRL